MLYCDNPKCHYLTCKTCEEKRKFQTLSDFKEEPIKKKWKRQKAEYFIEKYFQKFYHNMAKKRKKGGYQTIRKIGGKNVIVYADEKTSFFKSDDEPKYIFGYSIKQVGSKNIMTLAAEAKLKWYNTLVSTMNDYVMNGDWIKSIGLITKRLK